MMSKIKITEKQAAAAIAALRAWANDDEMVTPANADEAVADMAIEVQQVIAGDCEGGTDAKGAWPEPCTLDEIEEALNRAVRGEFELPDKPDVEAL